MSGIPEQAVPGEHGSGAGQWWVQGRLRGGAGRGVVDAEVWLLRMIGRSVRLCYCSLSGPRRVAFAAGQGDLN